MIKTFISLFAILVACNSYAGSRDGFRLVAIDLNSSLTSVAKQSIMDYFNDKYDENFYKCEKNKFNKSIDIEMVYINSRPKQLTDTLVGKLLAGEKNSFIKVKKALTSYRNDEIDKGFDALLVFKRSGESVELNIISPWDEALRKAVMIKSQPNQVISPNELKRSFCTAFNDLGYAYGE